MSVLVTGGSGFVGLNIASELLAQGTDVALFGPAAPPAGALAHLRGLKGVLTIAEGDVRDRRSLDEAIAATGASRLVHGAAITAGLEREAVEAIRIAEVNLLGTLNVLDAAVAAGIRRVVQLGTGSVFGSVPPDIDAIDETLPPVPDSLYGITKYAAERAAIRYRQTRGLDVVVARLGVVFGRWEYDTGVRDTLSVPLQLARLARAGEKACFRAGLPDDWVYAADIAGAVAALLDAPATSYPVYQIATGRRWSITDWCERLKGTYPGFDYALSADDALINVARAAPTARPPFRVDRLREDVGYRARFLEEAAFEDYLAWHRAGGFETPSASPQPADDRAASMGAGR
ncbi:NAD-dependent epimerase/dehydratase family protein [Enterovirga rhinocerotis]|uniref:Nucleoside-diphosphate-sugar epimerase n=1 Tax=Enterovirga rhinocerotis TaxID=1339210 RepID=A0A4R7BXK6_9HYPH|nr:NAD(P)-dependent oxidoreductase [Enterovirga rhinocerotis]TDR90243.1 nucleoside-diphosphate-sugar epimerase [Enterovirga rhinocerotis]